jgi:hypothetical protein
MDFIFESLPNFILGGMLGESCSQMTCTGFNNSCKWDCDEITCGSFSCDTYFIE